MTMSQPHGIANDLNRLARRLASPWAVFVTLPYLMVLLTLGTIAQKELGLYTAQKIFFDSWLIWLGPIPLPGAYLTIGFLTLTLFVKFVFFSVWRLQRAGTILTHLGVLILLGGGIVTAFSQREAYMILGPDEQSALIYDYHARALTIEAGGEPLKTLSFSSLHKGQTIKTGDTALPFALKILDRCLNCLPVAIDAGENSNRRGLAAEIALRAAPPEKEHEANLSGLTFEITGAGDGHDGLYVAMEDLRIHPQIKIGDVTYDLKMQRKSRPLPFSVSLSAFEKQLYPGTNVASAYASDIVITDGALSWPHRIEMNQPLRYRGYTFYQSSYSERPDATYSILSVVENKGRIFPYLASAIIFAGLLLHLLIRLRSMKGKNA